MKNTLKKIPCPQSAWSSGPSPLPKQGNSWPVRGAGCPAHALPWEPGSAHAAGTASCYQHPTQEPRAPGHNCVRCYLQRGRRCEQGFPRDLLQPRVHFHQNNRSEGEAASQPPLPRCRRWARVFFGSRGERTACNLTSPGRASCLEQKRRRAKCLQTGALALSRLCWGRSGKARSFCFNTFTRCASFYSFLRDPASRLSLCKANAKWKAKPGPVTPSHAPTRRAEPRGRAYSEAYLTLSVVRPCF